MSENDIKTGLLHELRSNMERKLEEERRRADEQRAQEEYYEHHLRPAMVRAQSFFSELAGYLKVVAPEVTVRYPLDPTSSQGVALSQGDYWYKFDNRENPQEIILSARCELARPVEFYVPTRDAATDHADLLNRMDFFHHCKYKRDAWHEICGGKFILEGPMIVHVRFFADAQKRRIGIALRNLEGLPHKVYRFEPEAVDEQLLERVARLLLRQEDHLVKVDLQEGMREQLRQQVAREKRLKELELSLALDEMERRKQQEAKEAQFINRAKKAIASLVNSIS